MKGPAAPKDAEEKKPSFYIMRGKQIAGAPVSEDKGVQFIYLNDDNTEVIVNENEMGIK